MMNPPSPAVTVVCVLRSGGEYRPEHVVALQQGVDRWWPVDWPLRFVCLSDQPIPDVETRELRSAGKGWWAKMELFAPEHCDLGDMLYIDLDTMIVGDLTAIARVGQDALLNDFYYERTLASGLMYLTPEMRAETWGVWSRNPSRIMHRFHRPGTRAMFPDGDGGFLDLLWFGRVKAWQDLVPGHVVSYKVHVRGRGGDPPAGARVVCFHGSPRPWETGRWAEYATS